jgi:hypothetical protein
MSRCLHGDIFHQNQTNNQNSKINKIKNSEKKSERILEVGPFERFQRTRRIPIYKGKQSPENITTVTEWRGLCGQMTLKAMLAVA